MIIKYVSTTVSAKLKANTNEPTEKSALVKFLRLSFPGVYERKNTAWVEIYQKSAFQKCPFYIYLFGCGIINDFTFYKARGVHYVIFPPRWNSPWRGEGAYPPKSSNQSASTRAQLSVVAKVIAKLNIDTTSKSY